MATKFNPPNSLSAFTSTANPGQLGLSVGSMMSCITYLVYKHIEHDVNHQNKAPPSLKGLKEPQDFVSAVDQYVADMRHKDGKIEALEKKKNIYSLRYRLAIEAAFKAQIIDILGSTFRAWSAEQTQEFNRGVEFVLSSNPWNVYPSENVVFVDGDWQKWLFSQCDALGMIEHKAGRRALRDESGF